MKKTILALLVLLLASPVYAGGMLKRNTVELGGSFSFSVQDGERYDDSDGDPRTVINLAAEPGGFIHDGLLFGAFLGWDYSQQGDHSGHGQLEIGPRFAYYFTRSPHGTVFTEGTVRFMFFDRANVEDMRIFSLGLV